MPTRGIIRSTGLKKALFLSFGKDNVLTELLRVFLKREFLCLRLLIFLSKDDLAFGLLTCKLYESVL
jgi:hypothetical protein